MNCLCDLLRMTEQSSVNGADQVVHGPSLETLAAMSELDAVHIVMNPANDFHTNKVNMQHVTRLVLCDSWSNTTFDFSFHPACVSCSCSRQNMAATG